MSKNQKISLSFTVGVVAVFAMSMIFGWLDFRSKEVLGEKPLGLPSDAMEIVQKRGLSPDDVAGALATYVPTGKYDDYFMFTSGGHSGQVFVIGLPSMRLLRVIATFTPESWQGYGFGVKETALSQSASVEVGQNGRLLTWADTHHPALSETGGEYDGQFLFIGDKANGRLCGQGQCDFIQFPSLQPGR